MNRIAITGSSGLIGEALVRSLRADGHSVQRVVRRPDRATGDHVFWDPEAGTVEAGKLEGVDAVVHLAGEPIGARRWTSKVKRRLVISRRRGTGLIAGTLACLDAPPRVLVSASAVGYYGDRGEERLTESSDAGDDFMARLCQVWERAAAPAVEAGIRVVHPRSGVIIARGGPLIEKVELPFRLAVGGKVGNGRQFVPWISLEDEVRAIRFVIDRELEGPVNLVAPTPVRNAELTRALGQVLHRPTVFRIPVAALRVVYGEVAVSLASVSQRVVPERLLDTGFSFRHPELPAALQVAFREEPAA